MTARRPVLVLALIASSLAGSALAAPGATRTPARAPAPPETRLGFSLGADAGPGGTALGADAGGCGGGGGGVGGLAPLHARIAPAPMRHMALARMTMA